MTIKSFAGHTPVIHSSVYIDDMAYVSGQTTIGANSSVWPMAVIRGDVNTVNIGQNSNVQDGAVLHVTHDGPYTPDGGLPLNIGDEVTIGHKAVLHACTIGNRCLIGMNSTVLDGAIIHDNTMIGAASLVTSGKILEGGFLWTGSPVKKVRPLSEKEIAWLSYSAQNYSRLAGKTKNENP